MIINNLFIEVYLRGPPEATEVVGTGVTSFATSTIKY
jgi:hypothetical protein